MNVQTALQLQGNMLTATQGTYYCKAIKLCGLTSLKAFCQGQLSLTLMTN